MKNYYHTSKVISVFFLLMFIYLEATAVTCSVDTVHYALNKSSAYRGITLGATSATAVAQYYRAPQPITVTGFEFYAYATGTPTVTLTCEIYLAAADSSPSGAPIRSATITIDSSTSLIYNSVMFSTPAVVASNYVLVVSNPSAVLNAVIICNDYTVGDGFGEYFALGRIAGTWLRGDDIVVGGFRFDADWIVEPYVIYNNADSIYTPSLTVCAGTAFSMSGFCSSIVNDDMYNVNAFIGVTATNTFGWTFGDTTLTRTSLPTVSHTYYVPGTYTVTLYDTIRRWRVAKCIASTTVSITVLPSVLLSSFTNSSGSLTVGFTNTATAGVSYTWTFGDGGSSTTTSPSHTYLLPGRYNVCLLAYNACDSTTQCDSITVTCPPPAIPGVITGRSTYCPGDIDTFSIAAVSGATSYTWSATGWTGSSTSTSIILTAGVTAGNIFVRSNSICGSSAWDSLIMSFGTPPAVPGLITGRSTYCPGDIDTFTIVPVSGAVSYTWTTPGWTGSSTTSTIILTAGSSAGNVSVASTNACGTSAASTRIITAGPPPPTPGVITGSSTYCAGLTYTYSVVPVTGATSYTWTTTGWTGTSTTNMISLVASVSSGVISVSCSNACGSSAASSKVIVAGAGPPSPGAITGATTPVCAGSIQNLTVPSVTGATSYIWTLPSGWTGTSTTNSISTTVDTSGGTVSVVAVNACGASVTPASITFTLGRAPDSAVSISGAIEICANTNTVYSTAAVAGASSYLWTTPSGWIGVSTSNSLTVTTGTISGVVSVSAVNICGTSLPISLAVTINSISAPISFTSQSQVPANGTITIGTPSGGVGPYQYALDAGPFQPGNSFSNIVSDTHRIIVKDLNGCTQVFVIYVPSTVGFADDALFDFLAVFPNPSSEQLHVHVEMRNPSPSNIVFYDLLGNQIYSEERAAAKYWDKTIDVSKLSKGTYVLKIIAAESQITRRVVIQ